MRPTPTRLREPHLSRLRVHLEALYAATDVEERLRADPVSFAHRYEDPRDVEIAGVVAAATAFGRVSLFRPLLTDLFARMDRAGGPRAYVDGFSPDVEGPRLAPIVYRWNRGIDWTLWFATLRRVLERHATLEGLFRRSPGDPDVRPALSGAIAELRDAAVAVAPACGLPVATFDALPRGFRYFLPSPDDGSACKRWNMFLRWMVRPPAEGIDLGVWSTIPTAALVVPLDTHVARIARFVGLTRRTDGSWRTAAEVTDNLRRLDPDDPVRFDFAIAHLGISGACRGRREPMVCVSCPLDAVCTAG